MLALSLSACLSVENESGDMSAPSSTGSILDAAPVLDIGGIGEDGKSILLDPRSVTRAADHVVIADHGRPAVIIFNLEGQHLWQVGRQGEGPGEFRGLSGVHLCNGDSIFVRDRNLHRMSVLDLAGNVVREYRTPIQALNNTCSMNGTVVVQLRSWGSSAPSGSEVQYSSLLFMSTVGDTIATLDSIRLGRNLPLAPVTSVATSTDRVYVGTAESPFVDVYSLTGEPMGRIATGDSTRRKLTREILESHVDELLSGITGASRQLIETQRRTLLDMPVGEYLPAYGRILAAPNATLWLDLTVPGDSIRTLRAISSTGTVIGNEHLPLGVDPLAVDDDYLFARYEDEAGEPHIVLYRIRSATDPQDSEA